MMKEIRKYQCHSLYRLMMKLSCVRWLSEINSIFPQQNPLLLHGKRPIPILILGLPRL